MSEHLYRIPFEVAESGGVKIIQGWHGPWSYKVLGFPDLSYAVDLGLPVGSKVVAAKSGEVLWRSDTGNWCYQGLDSDTGNNPPPYGTTNQIMLRHEGGEITLYSHLQRGGILVPKGVKVEEGEIIAITGLSGWVGPFPHLHFQVANYFNPYTTIPFAFKDYSGSLEHSQLYPNT